MYNIETLTPLQLNPKQQENKKNLLPHRELTQSIKSIKVKGPSFINNLVSDHSKYTKEAFNLWMDNTLSSKAILFLAFQMDQNKYNGPACHTALRFLPTRTPSTLRGFPLLKRETPKTLQTMKRATSTLPLPVHNVEGGDQ